MGFAIRSLIGLFIFCAVVFPAFAQQFNTSNGTNYGSNDSAFKMYWDNIADQLKIYSAPVGTAGNAITWTEGLTMSTSARIGIGMLNPDYSIPGVGTATLSVNDDLRIHGYGTKPDYDLVRANGTQGSETDVAVGNELGSIRWSGYRNGEYRHTTNIVSRVGALGANNVASDLAFRFSDTSGNYTEVLTLLSGGNVGIGTTSPQSTLHVPDGKYAQFEDNNAGAPAAGDCDNNAERGRMSIDTSNNRLYICNGATRGWDYVTLTD